MDRKELVEETVEETKQLAEQAKRVARSQARVAMEDVKDALAPAAPALQLGALAAALGVVGVALVALPVASRLASHPIVCGVLGGAALGLGIVTAQRAWQEVPPDLGDRVRSILRGDLKTAVDAATEPTRH